MKSTIDLLKLLQSARHKIEKYKSKTILQQSEINSLKSQLKSAQEELAWTQNLVKSNSLTANKPFEKLLREQSVKSKGKGKLADESEEDSRIVDSHEEISMLNGEVSLLQDENDDLKEENEALVKEIHDLTFQFEAEIEKLRTEKQEYIAKFQQSGRFKITDFW